MGGGPSKSSNTNNTPKRVQSLNINRQSQRKNYQKKINSILDNGSTIRQKFKNALHKLKTTIDWKTIRTDLINLRLRTMKNSTESEKDDVIKRITEEVKEWQTKLILNIPMYDNDIKRIISTNPSSINMGTLKLWAEQWHKSLYTNNMGYRTGPVINRRDIDYITLEDGTILVVKKKTMTNRGKNAAKYVANKRNVARRYVANTAQKARNYVANTAQEARKYAANKRNKLQRYAKNAKARAYCSSYGAQTNNINRRLSQIKTIHEDIQNLITKHNFNVCGNILIDNTLYNQIQPKYNITKSNGGQLYIYEKKKS